MREIKEEFTVHDVIQAKRMLEPMVCLYCGSNEVVYHQYICDAYCQDCSKWQIEDKYRNFTED